MVDLEMSKAGLQFRHTTSSQGTLTFLLLSLFLCLCAITLQFAGHDAGGTNVTLRITRHYKTVMDVAFRTFPDDPYVIILEEDLYVASDFYR